MVGTHLLKVQKSEMITLVDGVGWAPIIMDHPLPSFNSVLDLLLCGHVQQCGSLTIELFYLVKPSHFNMSISLKTIEYLSNRMFDDAEFLMTMHVCKEQLSHFLVFSY